MIDPELTMFVNRAAILLRKQFNYATENEWRFAQVAKLSEEVGELSEQVLGMAAFQRSDKSKAFNQASIESEVADVIICTLLIAHSFSVDADTAIMKKIAKINARYEVE